MPQHSTAPTRAQPAKRNTTGLILAGGKSRRMGGIDKGLYPVGGEKKLIEVVLSRLQPQVSTVLINANRNQEQYQQYSRVIADLNNQQWGPLAGIASALDSGAEGYILVCPCDAPYLPLDLGSRLSQAWSNQDTEACIAHDGNRLQPLFCLLHSNIANKLNAYLDAGNRRADAFLLGLTHQLVDFTDPANAFTNINSLEQAETLLATN